MGIFDDITAPFYNLLQISPPLIKIMIFFLVLGGFVFLVSAAFDKVGVCPKIDLAGTITGNLSITNQLTTDRSFDKLAGSQIVRGIEPSCDICYVDNSSSLCSSRVVDYTVLEGGVFKTYSSISCADAITTPGTQQSFDFLVSSCNSMARGSAIYPLNTISNRSIGGFDMTLVLYKDNENVPGYPAQCHLDYNRVISGVVFQPTQGNSVPIQGATTYITGVNNCDTKPGFNLLDYRLFVALGVASFLGQFAIMWFTAMSGFRQGQ